MVYLIGAGIYLALHFLAYLFWLRLMQLFTREHVIFLYHFASAIVVTLAVFAASLKDPSNMTLPFMVAIICLHGLYSLSFLELWALADAGFSLGILRMLQDGNASPLALNTLRALGDTKRGARTRDMVALGLVQPTRAGFELT